MLEEVRIEKLVHGGQGFAKLSNGKKVFVWGVLPNELVRVKVTKKRSDYCEAEVQDILEPSKDRIKPKDEAYMSTSPWQITSWESENKYKQQVLSETMQREKVAWDKDIIMVADGVEWHYRNKMEYSFWADDSGLHLALFHRGSHGKRIVEGSSIARPEIDKTANTVLAVLNNSKIRGSQLKTIIIRCNQVGETVAALFVKDEDFPKLKDLSKICKGVEVCYSTPKSPASVITKVLYKYGDTSLDETVMGTKITYDVHSFFQVNLPIFESALKRIDYFLGGYPKIDLYCGVGTIGLPIGGTEFFIDVDQRNCELAKENVGALGTVIKASAETALEYIDDKHALIVDPPRAGLHNKLIDKILDAKPPVIAYLSCNPSTQARDIALLQSEYKIKALEGYNFFPRTPHIESLAVMIRK